MSKKLNLKVTQNPDDKKLLYKTKKKSVFERNFDRKCYCWTHRYRVTNRHSSGIYSATVADHERKSRQKYHGRKRG